MQALQLFWLTPSVQMHGELPNLRVGMPAPHKAATISIMGLLGNGMTELLVSAGHPTPHEALSRSKGFVRHRYSGADRCVDFAVRHEAASNGHPQALPGR